MVWFYVLPDDYRASLMLLSCRHSTVLRKRSSERTDIDRPQFSHDIALLLSVRIDIWIIRNGYTDIGATEFPLSWKFPASFFSDISSLIVDTNSLATRIFLWHYKWNFPTQIRKSYLFLVSASSYRRRIFVCMKVRKLFFRIPADFEANIFLLALLPITIFSVCIDQHCRKQGTGKINNDTVRIIIRCVANKVVHKNVPTMCVILKLLYRMCRFLRWRLKLCLFSPIQKLCLV